MNLKKIIFILFIFLASFLFAQSEKEKVPEETQIIYPTKQYSQYSDTTIQIVYYPYIDEVRVIYYIPKTKFTQDEAVVICRNVLIDFMKDHGYYHYYFLRKPDQTIYSWREVENQKIAIVRYIVFVKMLD